MLLNIFKALESKTLKLHFINNIKAIIKLFVLEVRIIYKIFIL